MTESIQKQCNVSDNKYNYSIFNNLAYPPKTVPETAALSTELQAHLLLWPYYNRFEEQNLQILNSHFNPASRFFAPSRRQGD